MYGYLGLSAISLKTHGAQQCKVPPGSLQQHQQCPCPPLVDGQDTQTAKFWLQHIIGWVEGVGEIGTPRFRCNMLRKIRTEYTQGRSAEVDHSAQESV